MLATVFGIVSELPEFGQFLFDVRWAMDEGGNRRGAEVGEGRRGWGGGGAVVGFMGIEFAVSHS